MSDSPRSERFAEMCVTVFGSGYAPFASGSWGSLAATAMFAAPAVLFYCWLPSLSWIVDVAILTPGIVIASLLSIWFGAWALAKFGNKDPKPFVLDEFAGQWIAFVSLPLLTTDGGIVALLVLLGGQFFLFRVFDVIKPPPAAQLESLPSGWGVLCDDLMAGLYANIAGQLLWRFTPIASLLGLAAGA